MSEPTSAKYRYDVGVDDEGIPIVQAIPMRGGDGDEPQKRVTIGRFGMGEEAAQVADELNRSGDLEELDRVLDVTQSPLVTPHEEPAIETMRDHLANTKQRVLEPIDPTVNYSFEMVDVDPWTLELNANKWWLGDDGQVKQASQALQTYELPPHEIEREIERDVAALDRESLEFIHRTEGLQASMHEAEMLAVRSGYLDAERDDPRLFTQGPPDRFTILREAELAGQERSFEVRDEWEALLDHPTGYEPEPPAHYWQMQHRPAQTPDGQSLGVTLFVTEFPELPPDFDAYVDQHGMDDSLYPSQARTLEMAHFADASDARKFEAEFRSYLIPGLLDGPELAPEVAKLEGLSGEWQEMTERDILDSMSGNRTVIRDPVNWHPHNPNAEREARESYENPLGEIEL